MIPPLPDLRMRSIQRWLKDQPQTRSLPPEALTSRAKELDEQMMQAFSEQEDAIMWRMMRERVWGTEQGMQQFPLARLELWQEVCATFLPTSEPPQED